MEIEDESCINECIFRDILDTCSLNKKYGFKELSVEQSNTIQRCSMESNVIKQFIQNLKNDVITMIVTARIHREK